MFPLASFVYPVFVNLDIAKAAGVDKMPTNRTEFADSREEDDQRRQEPVRLGAAAVAARPRTASRTT